MGKKDMWFTRVAGSLFAALLGSWLLLRSSEATVLDSLGEDEWCVVFVGAVVVNVLGFSRGEQV